MTLTTESACVWSVGCTMNRSSWRITSLSFIKSSPGYQRQLTYLQGSGCFGIWSRSSCSLWYVMESTEAYILTEQELIFMYVIIALEFVSRLTAAVVNTFSGIVSFYRGDPSVYVCM